MSEQLLDLANIGFAFQKMRRASVAKRVRRNVLFDAGVFSGFPDDSHKVVRVELAARARRNELNKPLKT